jgi:diguanylate cyclase (GGDEF)-like protein/PAS domain S-box-containing protein
MSGEERTPSQLQRENEELRRRLAALEEELVLRNVLLATQQETSLDGILVVDEGGTILSYNGRFVAMWRIPAEVIETRSEELALKAVLDKLADPRQFLEKVEHLHAHRAESSTDEIALKDERRFERNSAPMFGPDGRCCGRVWRFRDVTEHKRLEESLQLTQFAVDTTAEPILWIRQDGALTYANDAMCRLLGYSREEMLGLRVFDLDVAHTEETWRARWEEAKQWRTLHAETFYRRKDGGTVPVEISSNFVEIAGKSLLCSFVRDSSERKRTEEELFRIATTDGLTGALNRRYFLLRCNQEIQSSRRYRRHFSTLMLDLDHFKRINDEAGHAAGDDTLRAFARVCAAHLRKADLFGRLGGEEFAIALPETPAEGAVVVAERLRAVVAETEVNANGSSIRFTVSIGVTELSSEDRDIEDIHRRADDALYEAKNNGRNRVVTRCRVPG